MNKNEPSKSELIDAFNKQFIDFIKDIERVFPDDFDIKVCRKIISKAVIILPKTLQKLFHEHFVTVYKPNIVAGDIEFFVTNDYRKAHGYKETDESWVMDKIDCLRTPLQLMIPCEKALAVKYMQNLTILSDSIKSLNDRSK